MGPGKFAMAKVGTESGRGIECVAWRASRRSVGVIAVGHRCEDAVTRKVEGAKGRTAGQAP